MVLILGVACTILSCATSSGSTYSSSLEGESSAAARAAEAKKERQDSRPAESAETAGQDWLYTGTQAYPGTSHNGNGESLTIVFTIVVPSGTITVYGAPIGADLLVDGMPKASFMATGSGTQATATVEAGQRRIRAESFGYSSWESDVLVGSNSQVSLQAKLHPLPFSLRSPSTSVLVFDPSQPGRAGTVTAGFSATAPGTATAMVLDGSGRLLRTLGSQDIHSRSVPVTWDGRDDSGLAVPPGTYTIQLRGSGQGPAPEPGPGPGPASGTDSRVTASEATIQVTITSLPPVRASSLHGGFSGAMLAPDALILPSGSLQMSAGGYAFIDLGIGTSKARIPVWTGLRVGGFPYSGAELVLSAMLTSYPGYTEYPPMDGISVAGSIKSPLLYGNHLAAALLLRAAAATFTDEASSGWPPSWDGAARYPGAGGGIIIQWTPGGKPGGTPGGKPGGTPGGKSSRQDGENGRTSGSSSPGRLFASVEMNASRFYPGYGDMESTEAWEVPGFFAWPYARAGLETLLDLKSAGTLSIQGSAAARGQPVGTTQGFRPPLSLAGELAWYPPEAPYVLHLYGIGEWEGFYSWYFAGGAGISVLY